MLRLLLCAVFGFYTRGVGAFQGGGIGAVKRPAVSAMRAANVQEQVPIQPDRLSEYVTAENLVDYAKFTREGEWLNAVLEDVKKTDQGALPSAADRNAFLINAYNIWTIKWVLKERQNRRWKGHLGFLDKARFFYLHKITVSGRRTNLYNFENKDIRPVVGDARVHFALNCAGFSCPPLRRSLYTGSNLDAELDEVTQAAVNGGATVQRQPDGSLLVNPIFKWYEQDFAQDGGILGFVQKHWRGDQPIPNGTAVKFFEYDWRVNAADAPWADRALGGPAP